MWVILTRTGGTLQICHQHGFGVSHPHVYGENFVVTICSPSGLEPFPRVRGVRFLARLNNQSSREIHSLCTFPLRGLGLSVSLDGDPQADLNQPSWSWHVSARLDYPPLPSLIGEVSNAL